VACGQTNCGPTHLNASALALTFACPDVASVLIGGTELLRRVGVRVRPRGWGTVPAVVSDLDARADDAGFEVRFSARHDDGELAVSWTGTVEGGHGALSFEMDGRFERDAAYARVGIVLLHPPAVTAGRPFRARGPDGPQTGTLPRLVGPQLVVDGVIQPLFPAFEELEVDIVPGRTLVLELEGDVFEMEDQRNWTDASFKTYSTPVGLPVPHRAHAGQEVRQRVRAHVRGARRAPRPGAPRPVRLVVGAPLGRTVPPVGVGLGDSPVPDAAVVRALRPAYLRLEGVDPATVRDADALVPLELAVRVPDERAEAERRLETLAGALGRSEARVERIALLSAGAEVTRPRDVALARACLQVPLVAGSDANFAELNRARALAREPVDGLAFAVNPQVHDEDDDLVLQAAGAQRDAVTTARSFAGGLPVHVGPITFGPRGSGGADPRLTTSYGAAWTVASAAALASAGAASATYFALSGDEGVARDGELLPVGRVLSAVCAWRGLELLAVDGADPQRVAVLAVATAEGPSALVANVTPAPLEIDLAGLGPPASVRLEAYAVLSR
jgi:D-apionolactonase